MKLPGTIFLLVLCACSAAGSYPIGGIPTALMAPDNTVTFNYYSADTRARNPLAPQSADLANAFIGINPRFEIHLNYAKLESLPSETSADVQYLLVPGPRNNTAVALGYEDITQDENENSSVYLVASKVITRTSDAGPVFPLVRLHLGYGTEQRSGFFGGIQYRANSEFTFVALTDGDDGILGVGYYVPNTTLLLKAGNFGRARYWGAEYRIPFD